ARIFSLIGSLCSTGSMLLNLAQILGSAGCQPGTSAFLPNTLPPRIFAPGRLRTAEQDARPPETNAQSNLLRRSRHSLLFNENCRLPLRIRGRRGWPEVGREETGCRVLLCLETHAAA